MAPNLRIEVAQENELDDLVKLIVPNFASFTTQQLLDNIDTPEAIAAATERHKRNWRDHMAETGLPSAIKCIYTDPDSGKETLIACAEWLIYTHSREAEKARRSMYLVTGDWLPADAREKVQEMYKLMLDTRYKWTAGRGHAILMYMATDQAWRRRGAATACVQWGLDRCQELGIPAYLEASEEGRPVYEKLGFQKMDEVTFEIDGEVEVEAAMMWWPVGTKEEDKRPVK